MTAILLALLFSSFFQAQPARLSITAAVAELNKGNLFEGVRQLKEIVRAEPASAAAYFYLSGVYLRLGHTDTAYRYLASAMNANPDQGAYYHQLGLIRNSEGCRPEALSAYQQALQKGMGKEEAAAWRHVGDVYVDLLASGKAVEAYQTALKIDPNDAAAHLALGKLYLDRNNRESAIQEFNAAMKLSPGLESVRSGLARAYRADGDLIAAVNIAREAVQRNPTDQEARYVLGQALLALGRSDEGRREMEDYRRIDERVAETNKLFESAVQRAQAGELDRAEDLLKQTLRLAPQYAPALRVFGEVELNRGKSQHAIELLKQAMAANPLNPATYFSLAAVYMRDGKLSDALEMANRALILDEEDARYYSLLGAVYARMKRPAEARAATERAAQLQARAAYPPSDSYSAEMRRRADSATVKAICGTQR